MHNMDECSWMKLVTLELVLAGVCSHTASPFPMHQMKQKGSKFKHQNFVPVYLHVRQAPFVLCRGDLSVRQRNNSWALFYSSHFIVDVMSVETFSKQFSTHCSVLQFCPIVIYPTGMTDPASAGKSFWASWARVLGLLPSYIERGAVTVHIHRISTSNWQFISVKRVKVHKFELWTLQNKPKMEIRIGDIQSSGRPDKCQKTSHTFSNLGNIC